MQKETKEVIWEWLPGIVAGIMPLLVFLLVSMQVPGIKVPPDHIPVNRYQAGWIAHLLVLGIVTSTVSTFTAFPRLFARGARESGLGPSALGLMMTNTLILVFSVALYVMHEAHLPESYMILWAAGAAALSALSSLFIEFSIANVRLAGAPTEEDTLPVNEQGAKPGVGETT